MKTKCKTINTKLALLTLLLTTSVVVILGFKSDTSKPNELILVTVRMELDHQIIYISESKKVVKRIAVLDSMRTRRYRFMKKDYQKDGYFIDNRSLQNAYDYNAAFELISDFETAGWTLKSHGFGASGYDEISDHSVSQFLLFR
ncbi:MAG: hypothetical protein JXR19_06700 [Bacteroidia bacterium]